MDRGSATAPVTVRLVWVTGIPSAAAAMLMKVSTLFTAQPTSLGKPPTGISLPVTSVTTTYSSPEG